jgi:hypothetical protein
MVTSAYRRSMAAGVAFVVLFVVGTLFTIDSPSTKSSDTATTLDQKWISYLSSSSHRTQHVIGGYLLILAGIAVIWFCQGLRVRLDAAAPTDLIAGRVVSALSVFGAAALAAAAMTTAVIPGAVIFGGEKAPTTGDSAHWINELTFPFIAVVFGLVSAALIASVIVAGKATLPKWAVATGWLAVLGSIAAVIFLPLVLPLLWYLAVAITGLRTPTPAR